MNGAQHTLTVKERASHLIPFVEDAYHGFTLAESWVNRQERAMCDHNVVLLDACEVMLDLVVTATDLRKAVEDVFEDTGFPYYGMGDDCS